MSASWRSSSADDTASLIVEIVAPIVVSALSASPPDAFSTAFSIVRTPLCELVEELLDRVLGLLGGLGRLEPAQVVVELLGRALEVVDGVVDAALALLHRLARGAHRVDPARDRAADVVGPGDVRVLVVPAAAGREGGDHEHDDDEPTAPEHGASLPAVARGRIVHLG